MISLQRSDRVEFASVGCSIFNVVGTLFLFGQHLLVNPMGVFEVRPLTTEYWAQHGPLGHIHK